MFNVSFDLVYGVSFYAEFSKMLIKLKLELIPLLIMSYVSHLGSILLCQGHKNRLCFLLMFSKAFCCAHHSEQQISEFQVTV